MKYFDTYRSNTTGGSGTQNWFEGNDGVMRGRVYYRVEAAGRYNYSFLFSNTVQGTFADGIRSYRNLELDSWELVSLRAGVSNSANPEAPADFETEVLFDGKPGKTVEKGELFSSDPVSLDIPEDSYLYLDIFFSGRQLPCHTESVLPVFRYNGEWQKDANLPVPCMVGCDRSTKLRLAFLGDSITQGCCTPRDSYTHYAARLQKMLDGDIAVWDLGLGYGRAQDMASRGIWAELAIQNDAAVVCYGVNDILRGRSSSEICTNLAEIVLILTEAKIPVLVQTVPPYNYKPELAIIWNEVNGFIKNELSKKVPVFDNVPVLGEGPDYSEGKSAYGSHPNAEGHGKWAEAMLPELKHFLTANAFNLSITLC